MKKIPEEIVYKWDSSILQARIQARDFGDRFHATISIWGPVNRVVHRHPGRALADDLRELAHQIETTTAWAVIRPTRRLKGPGLVAALRSAYKKEVKK